jgi:hypothetical protein
MSHGRRNNWPSYLSVKCATDQDECKEWACQCRCHAPSPQEEEPDDSEQGTRGAVGTGAGS